MILIYIFVYKYFILSSVRMWYICMCFHRLEVYTRTYMVWDGSLWISEFCNRGDVPGDNL